MKSKSPQILNFSVHINLSYYEKAIKVLGFNKVSNKFKEQIPYYSLVKSTFEYCSVTRSTSKIKYIDILGNIQIPQFMLK